MIAGGEVETGGGGDSNADNNGIEETKSRKSNVHGCMSMYFYVLYVIV
jgi:hypothetical protein